MPRKQRAKQFAPFDALKGLHEALKLKEYEHDRMEKGDISPEQIENISKLLLDLKKDEVVKVKYFQDGYNKELTGKSRVDILEQTIKVNDILISFDDIIEIEKHPSNQGVLFIGICIPKLSYKQKSTNPN